MLQTPLGAISPNSASWPRKELIRAVRCRTSSSRVRCSIKPDCCSALLISTNLIVGRGDCLTDRFRVDRVVLSAFHIRFDVARPASAGRRGPSAVNSRPQ